MSIVDRVQLHAIREKAKMKLAKDFDTGIGVPLLLYTTAFALSFSSLAIASTLLYTALAY
jgi:hypothetical protein